MLARPSPRALLAIAGALMLGLRLALVAATADVQTDAYGHYRIARALLNDPRNLHVHWVWLPGWHYVVWGLLHVGVGFTGLRVISSLAQAGAPFLLYDMVARRTAAPGDLDAEHARRVALVAALLFTIAPLANRLATSAQAETCFALVVLASAWAIERRRFVLAGVLLAVASTLRYEAWGAIPALALLRLRRRADGPSVISFALPALVAVGWIVLRRWADGEWLTFLRHTHSFADGVRQASARSPVVDGVLVPLALPPLVLGPAIVLLPLGLRRAVRAGWVVAAGLLTFLLVSHVGRGALGLDRYLTALVPFACVAMAEGAYRLPKLAPRVRPRLAVAFVLGATAITALAHLGWLVQRARSRDAELRGYESDVERS